MDLNRRKILSAIALAGAGATLGGTATRAVFNDEESVSTTVAAGELDIQLDWKAIHNGDVISEQLEPVDANGVVAAHFEDVKPGDTGCFSLSIHNETNPAWVWLAMDIVDETDGGVPPSGENGCPPAQYPWVCGQEETDGDVTVSNDGSNLIIEINSASGETLEETSVEVTDSIDNIPSGGGQGGPAPGQFEYQDSDAETVQDSYVKYVIPLSDEGLACGDSTIIAVHAAASDGETCWAGSTEIPGANWALAIDHTICCPDSESSDGTEETQTESVLADNIFLDVFWDDDVDCEIDDGEIVLFQDISLRTLEQNISKSTGGIMPQWYSTGTQYVSLAWNIPTSVGNEIQGDEVELNFTVYAEQRRNNSNPDNPWN